MLIAVYGTLKRGYGNYERLLSESRFIGTAITAPVFTMLNLGSFPGIVRGGETAISCEVFEVDAPTLARLDRLEGHPSFYERQPLTVTLEDGTAAAVEGYVLPASILQRSHVTEIPSGVWGR